MTITETEVRKSMAGKTSSKTKQAQGLASVAATLPPVHAPPASVGAIQEPPTALRYNTATDIAPRGRLSVWFNTIDPRKESKDEKECKDTLRQALLRWTKLTHHCRSWNSQVSADTSNIATSGSDVVLIDVRSMA